MDSTEIEDFNWNLRHFLDVMDRYQTNVNKANSTTLQLLENTLDKLGNLIENVDEIEDERNNGTIITSIDESKFDVKRSIFCRICKMDFDATRTNYLLHSSDDDHNRKLIEYTNETDTNNNGSVSAEQKIQSTDNHSKILPEQLSTLISSKRLHSLADEDGLNAGENEAKTDGDSKQSTAVQQFPDVFGNGIFAYLDSLNKSEKAEPRTNSQNTETNSWRTRSNETQQTAKTEQWRRNTNSDKLNHNPIVDPLKRSKPSDHTRSSRAQSTVQNGAKLTGVGIRPSPTYQLNNMYEKFPHLNPNKVPNPLKPTQSSTKELSGRTNSMSSLAQISNERTLDANRQRWPSSNNLATNSAQHKIQSKDGNKTGAIRKKRSTNDAQVADIKGSTNTCDSKPTPIDSSVDASKLKKFFSNDLTSLINMTVEFNSRQKNADTQRNLIESVENLLKPKFPTVKAWLIGSYAYEITKAGLAPVDIYLDLHNSFNADKTGSVFIQGMSDTVKLMQNNSEWTNIQLSERSRHAILSADHIGSDTSKKCQFTFGTGVAVKNTEIVKGLLDAQIVARQVVICIRLALQYGSTGEWATLFNGYVVTLLVIFYFQIEKKLPSISSLQSGIPPMKCGENRVHFKMPSDVTVCKDRIRDLLIGFFSYYENFDFLNKIISPFEGDEIPKNSRNDSMSQSVQRFKNMCDVEPKRWIGNHMCVQDIFEHKWNVTHKIMSSHIKAFKDFCKTSLSIIQEIGPSVKY